MTRLVVFTVDRTVNLFFIFIFLPVILWLSPRDRFSIDLASIKSQDSLSSTQFKSQEWG